MLSKSRIKYIQSLHQKKFRELEGAYLAEGPKIVGEVLALIPERVLYVAALKEWLDEHRDLVSGLAPELVCEVLPQDLEKISALTTPNEVLVVLKKFDNGAAVLPAGSWSIGLDGIQDPGNIGTIIRIADWFGIEHLVCSADCADMYNPKVVQATMGSFLRVQVHYVDLVHWLADYKGFVYATTLGGRPLNDMAGVAAGVILVGNEGKGIRPEVLAHTTEAITIPKRGGAESLNAAVATGIVVARLVN